MLGARKVPKSDGKLWPPASTSRSSLSGAWWQEAQPAAVNTASRLESLTKVLRQRVLVSRAFAEKAGCFQALESLGRHALRGLDKEVEVFAFKAETCEYQTQ